MEPPPGLTPILAELFERADTLGRFEVGAAEVEEWPDTAVEDLVRTGLLVRLADSSSVVCPGCEEMCVVEPLVMPGIVPERLVHPCHVYDYGSIQIDPARRRRWRLDLGGVARAVRAAARLSAAFAEVVPARLWALGRAAGRGAGTEVFLAAHAAGPQGPLSDAAWEYVVNPGSVVIALHHRPARNARPETVREVQALGELIRFDRVLTMGSLWDGVLHGAGHSGHEVDRVPVPPGARWEEVLVEFEDGETVDVTVGGRGPYRRTCEQLGMAHVKTGRPSQAWALLRAFAAGAGALPSPGGPRSEKQRTAIRGFRQALIRAIPIIGDPLFAAGAGEGWRVRFQIHAEPDDELADDEP